MTITDLALIIAGIAAIAAAAGSISARPALAAIGVALIILVADVAAAQARPAMSSTASSTAYCLGGRMADGTPTRRRSAASNRHPLGTRIRLTGRQAGPGGLRLYVIRDRIGHGTELDLWTPSCGAAIRYGRRHVTYRLGWAR